MSVRGLRFDERSESQHDRHALIRVDIWSVFSSQHCDRFTQQSHGNPVIADHQSRFAIIIHITDADIPWAAPHSVELSGLEGASALPSSTPTRPHDISASDLLRTTNARTQFPRVMGWKYSGTITFVFGEATAISFKKDCRASSAGC